jgi:hypothetical protein
MATPRVFVSSTCYDLKYIRENLKYFIRTVGYEPVLSEDGAVYFNPSQHTHDSCLSEVPNCQMFVLIIGGRYGGCFKDGETSITNEEYREAKKQKIPVFALVESAVYSDHHVYNRNRDNKIIDATSINYPSVDNANIFKFIDEVKSATINNAIVPFRDFSDIESYLKQQWAGMMFSFLIARNEDNRVTDMMSHLLTMNERIEFMSSQLVKSVGSAEAIVIVQLYEKILGAQSMKALSYIGLKPDPISVLQYDTLNGCAQILGNSFKPKKNVKFSISSGGEVEQEYFNNLAEDYKKLRSELVTIMDHNGMSLDRLEKYEVTSSSLS